MSLIDDIVRANLFQAKCADNDDHACIVVWSSGAEEQLEAIVSNYAENEERIREVRKPLVDALELCLDALGDFDITEKRLAAVINGNNALAKVKE